MAKPVSRLRSALTDDVKGSTNAIELSSRNFPQEKAPGAAKGKPEHRENDAIRIENRKTKPS